MKKHNSLYMRPKSAFGATKACAAIGMVSLSALIAATAAAAQVTPAPKTDAAEDKGITEVVITAERRVSTVQKSPLTVDVVSGQELAQRGITDGKSIADVTPGVKLFHERGGTSVYIRGIGSSASNPYADSNISYNIDGVAITLPSGVNGAFYDTQRLEVLKGPQGTLYGRNATAGAINVISNDPQSVFDAALEGTVGNYSLAEVNGMINVPFSDTFSARFAFKRAKHDGYLSNGLADGDDTAARLKLLWKPNEDVRILFGADYYYQGGKGDQRVPVIASTGQLYWPTVAGGTPWTIYNIYPSPVGGETQVTPDDTWVKNRNLGVWVQFDADLGWGHLTVIPSLRKYHQNWKDADSGFGYEQIMDDTAKTLELRLSSDPNADTRLKWVIGGFLLDEKMPNWVRVQQSYPVIGSGDEELFQVTQSPDQATKSSAIFGQMTYSVSDTLRLTAGARYTEDKKSETGYTTNDIAAGLAYTFNMDWTSRSAKTTWRLGFDKDLAKNVLLYGNASTGYKAGGIGAGPTPGATPGLDIDPSLVNFLTYKPEQITAYELGLKSSWMNRRLTVNLSAFRWEYKDQQVQTIFLLPLPSLPPVIVPSVVNAGSGIDQGIDLDLVFKPTANDRIGLSVEYLDTHYDDFSYPFIFVDNAVVNDGKPFVNAPKLAGTIEYGHDWNLANGDSLAFNLSSHITDKYWVGYNYTPKTEEQEGYHRTDLSLEYNSAQNWYARLWVKNLENVGVKSVAGLSVPGSTSAPTPVGPDAQSLEWAVLQAPRTFGLTIGKSF